MINPFVKKFKKVVQPRTVCIIGELEINLESGTLNFRDVIDGRVRLQIRNLGELPETVDVIDIEHADSWLYTKKAE